MKKLKKSERIGVLLLLLSKTPNKLITLSQLSSQFGCAKSTLSEDITSAKAVLEQSGMGRLETVPGAAGGVRYLPFSHPQANLEFVAGVCEELKRPERLYPGGFLYTIDVFSDPRVISRLGSIFAQVFYRSSPDVVVTAESAGVPIGLMTAQALGAPLVVARKDNRITYGSVVTLNYLTTSSKRLQTMSLPRRAVKEGQRALVIDDFTRGGGTVGAICDMMKEFSASVVGAGTLISAGAARRRRGEVRSLMTLESLDEEEGVINIRPSDYMAQAAAQSVQVEKGALS